MADRGIIARGIGYWIHRRAKITGLGKTSMISTRMLMRPRFSISETRHRAAPEASQKAAMKVCDGKWKTHLMRADATLLRQFKERWIEAESNRSALRV